MMRVLLVIALGLPPSRALRRQDPGPGDIGSVPDMEDLLRGAGQDQADEDTAQAIAQLGGAVDDSALPPDQLATKGIRNLEGGVNSAVENIGRSPITDALASARATEGGLAGNVPESAANLEGYTAPMATPRPAPLSGVYCRGGACRYRKEEEYTLPDGTKVSQMVLTTLPPREFCRGLACDPEAGFPSGGTLNSFTRSCMHLFEKIGGGLKGPDGERTVVDVKDSFAALCPARVNPKEAEYYCSDYSDVFIAAMSAELLEKTVGDSQKVCTHVFKFMEATKRAEIDMKLFVGAFREATRHRGRSGRGSRQSGTANMQGPRQDNRRSQMLLSRAPAQLDLGDGEGGVGPQSMRGRQWRTWLADRQRGPPVPAATLAAGAVHTLSQAGACREEPLDESSSDAKAYNYNPPCKHGYNNISQARTEYMLQPGTTDGTMRPIEVPGDLFTYCTDQVREITGGSVRTAPVTAMMTRDWCNWRATLTGEEGKPEWAGPSCTGMAELVTFALRNHFQEPGGIGAAEVCKSLFSATGVIRRVEQIVNEAWTKDLRGVLLRPPIPPPLSDTSMQEVLELILRKSSEAQEKLEEQRRREKAVEEAKDAVAAYENGDGIVQGLTEGLGLPTLG